MNFKKNLLATAILPIVALAGYQAPASAYEYNYAEEDTGPYFYVGADYGLLAINADDEEDFEEDNDAYSAYVGGKFLGFLGAELGYVDFGESGENESFTNTKGVTLSGMLYVLHTDYLNVFLRAGGVAWDTEIDARDGFNDDFDGEDFYYGVGFDFGLNDSFDIRAQWNRYEIEVSDSESVDGTIFAGESLDLDYVSVGVRYSFR